MQRKRKTNRWGAVAGLVCLMALSPVARAQKYRLGISISSQEYASRAFTNMLAMDARVWLVGTTTAAPVDENGMPLVDCDIYVLDGWYAQTHGAYGFNGTYRLVFNGQATVLVGGGSVQSQNYDPATNRSVVEILVTEAYPTLGLRLQNTRRTATSETNTGVTGLKLMRPTQIGATTSYDPSIVFTDEYKALHNRGEVLRSMDFVSTNGNIQREWADRQLPENLCFFNELPGYWWQGKGAPWEHFITLCNEVDKDAWVNVPILASDDYVVQLARMLKTRLEPGRKIYVEYSNEIWNFAFPTYYRVQEMAEAEVRANAATPINFDGACLNPDGSFNSAIGVPRYWAKRTKEISDIFRAEFGDGAMHDGAQPRVFPLFETQAAWQTWIYEGLNFLERYYDNGDGLYVVDPRPVPSILWGGGGSGYMHWFPEEIFNDPNATVDDIFNGYAQSWDHQYEAMTASSHWCAAFGLKRVAYEGGLSAFDGGPAQAASMAAQLDPRVKDAWKRCADEFFRAGGELYVHYLGVRQDYGLQPFDAVLGTQPIPKLQGFDELMAAPERPAPTIGTPVPGTLNAGRYHVSSDGWSTGTTDNPLNFNGNYQWASYTVRAAEAQTVSISLTAGASSGGQAIVFVNGKPAGTINLVAGTSSAAVIAPVWKGMNGIRIQRSAGTFALTSISVEPKSIAKMTLALSSGSIYAGSKTTGTVTLGVPAPAGGTVVALASSQPNVATLPSTVTVEAGQTTQTFEVTGQNVSAPTTTTIRASISKFAREATLTVSPIRPQSVTVNPGSVVGGSKSKPVGTVTLVGPAPSAMRVDLSSSDADVRVPAYVTIPPGATSATFKIVPQFVSEDKKVTLTATVNGASSRGKLQVLAIGVSDVTLTPSAVFGGNSANGVVTLNGPAPEGGATITMLSSNAAAVPTTVVVPVGATQATFAVTTSPVPTDRDVTITARLNTRSATAPLTVRAPILKNLKLSAKSVVGGSSTVVTGTLTLGSPAPNRLTVNLAIAGMGATVPAKVTFAPGATTATFVVSHTSVAANAAVDITATLRDTTKTARLIVQK